MAISYPVTVFHFQCEWGGTRIGFTEVSGLTVELQNIDYREGSSPEYQVTKMPGIPQQSDITLKRRMPKSDNEFYTSVFDGRERTGMKAFGTEFGSEKVTHAVDYIRSFSYEF